MPMTMEERFDHARAALNAYFAEKGEPARENDQYEDTDVSDVIADLLHLQKHLNLRDIDKTLATAQMHFEAEQADLEGGRSMTDTLIQRAINEAHRIFAGCAMREANGHIINEHSCVAAACGAYDRIISSETSAKKYPLEEFRFGLVRIDFRDHTVADIRLLRKVCEAVCPTLDGPAYSFSECYYCENGRWYAGGPHQLIGNTFDIVKVDQIELSEPKTAGEMLLNEEDLAHRISTALSKDFDNEPWCGMYDDMTVRIIEAISPNLRAIHDNGYRSGMLQERAITASTKREAGEESPMVIVKTTDLRARVQDKRGNVRVQLAFYEAHDDASSLEGGT